MAPAPMRARAAEDAVRTGADPATAAALADAGADPSADLNATVEFRRHLARVLVRRALTRIATASGSPTDGSGGSA
jgi:carbon-monoxide dehydrogenase medium subunit